MHLVSAVWLAVFVAIGCDKAKPDIERGQSLEAEQEPPARRENDPADAPRLSAEAQREFLSTAASPDSSSKSPHPLMQHFRAHDALAPANRE